MPTVGEQFRHAREAQHLDVYQMAEITKIKTDHIRALAVTPGFHRAASLSSQLASGPRLGGRGSSLGLAGGRPSRERPSR
jgi:hypothetical protein